MMRWFTANPEKHDFLVVQDLRPFGYRIESSHRTLTQARRACRHTRYLKVETREWVKRESERYKDPEEFMLACHAIAGMKSDVFRRFSQSVDDR